MSLTPTIARIAAEKAATDYAHVNVLAKHPQDALDAVARELPGDLIARTCRANGAERIDLSNGGAIRFGSMTYGFRGAHGALLIVPIGIDRDTLTDLLPTNPDEVLGYM